MQLCFLDDAKTFDRSWFGIGGFIVDGNQSLKFEADFLKIVKLHKIPVDDDKIDTEIKWSPDRSQWLHKNLVGAERKSLFRGLLALLEDYQAVLVASLIHQNRIGSWGGEKVRDNAYIYLFERIEEYAKFKAEPALLICDMETDPKKTNLRIKKCLSLVRSGSPYLKFANIYNHPWTVDSRHHSGCQMADLIIGITINMIAKSKSYASDFWDLLRGKFMLLGHLSTPQRYGLSILPSDEIPDFVSTNHPYSVLPV